MFNLYKTKSILDDDIVAVKVLIEKLEFDHASIVEEAQKKKDQADKLLFEVQELDIQANVLADLATKIAASVGVTNESD